MTTFYHNPTTAIHAIERPSENSKTFRLVLDNVEFMFSTNFAGEITGNNRNGFRQAIVCFSYEDATLLKEQYGFKIYDYDPRKNNPELDPEQYPNKLGITMKLDMDSDFVLSGKIEMPSIVSVIEGKEDISRIVYSRETVRTLDTAHKIYTTMTVNCSFAKADKGQKWTQPYISQMGCVLTDRSTLFEERFGFGI